MHIAFLDRTQDVFEVVLNDWHNTPFDSRTGLTMSIDTIGAGSATHTMA